MRGAPSYYATRLATPAGKGAYRRFAERMAGFRAAMAEVAATSKPDLRYAGPFEEPGARAERHRKVVTKLTTQRGEHA